MSNATTITKWSRFEQSFTSSVSYKNPVQDVSLTVTFTAPAGIRYQVSAFWDGTNVWKMRFMPNETGTWRYQTHASDADNSGLHNRAGTFICDSAPGETRFDQHGPLQLSEDRHFLEHADGTPFFWLADTAWNGPLRSLMPDWAYYLQERTRQKFSAVQWVATQWISAPDGDLRADLPYTGNDRIAINPVVYQRLDARLEAMNRAGLLGVPVLLWAAEWGDPAVMAVNPGLTLPESQAILLARYMVARWQAHFVVWILPGDGDYQGAKAERWKRIGRAVFGEGLHAPVVLHPNGLSWHADEFKDESWLDMIGYQSCHFADEKSLTWFVEGPPAQTRDEHPVRPILNLEPLYENIVDLANTIHRFDAYEVRRALYWSLLVSPTAGVSYGGHGVWAWDDGTQPPLAHPQTGIPFRWQDALNMPGAEQAAHLSELFGTLEWWRLRPAQWLIAVQPGDMSKTRYIMAACTESLDLAVIYIPQDRDVTLNLERWLQALNAEWVDPRTGQRSAATLVSDPGMAIATTPSEGDWILLLRSVSTKVVTDGGRTED